MRQRHEVRVERDGAVHVIVAEPDGDRLVIRRGDAETGSVVGTLTVSDPEELQTFFDGLRQVLGEREAEAPPIEPVSPPDVAAWMKDDEPEAQRGFSREEPVASIARAVEARLAELDAEQDQRRQPMRSVATTTSS